MRRSSTTPRSAILPKHILGIDAPGQLDSAAFNINPVGTGPYRFDHLIVEGGQIAGVVLTRERPLLRHHAVHPAGRLPLLSRTSRTAFEAYEQGEVLGVSEISTSTCFPMRLPIRSSALYTSQLPQISMVMLNTKSQDAPFLDNANVRRALLLGLNRNYHHFHLPPG